MLKVISRSAFDLQAVFDTLVHRRSNFAAPIRRDLLRDGDVFRYRRHGGADVEPEVRAICAAHPQPSSRTRDVAGRALLSGQVEHIPDIARGSGLCRAGHGAAATTARALLGVPLAAERTGRVAPGR